MSVRIFNIRHRLGANTGSGHVNRLAPVNVCLRLGFNTKRKQHSGDD